MLLFFRFLHSDFSRWHCQTHLLLLLLHVSSSPTSSQSSEDNILTILGGRVSHAPLDPLMFPDQRVDPSSPPSGYTMIYSSCFHVGFCNGLSWLMMEYCELVHLAPGQLDFISWGLIHLFQVLSDFRRRYFGRDDYRSLQGYTLVERVQSVHLGAP